nr:hypothetical protein [uncultured Acetatifactor sp.]
MVGEILNRPLPSGIFLECQLDQRCPLFVQHYGPLLTALIINAPDIQISQWCQARRASILDLFVQALFDLIRQVLRVKLSNRAHDAVEQHPGWGVVNAL